MDGISSITDLKVYFESWQSATESRSTEEEKSVQAKHKHNHHIYS